MKYILSFSEGVFGGTAIGFSPRKYRDAAYKLTGYKTSQSIESSSKLIDWANEKEYGFYKMHYACGSNLMIDNANFTKPELIGIYYGSLPPSNSSDSTYNSFYAQNNLLRISDTESRAESLVDNWCSGGNLSISFEFSLMPSQEAIKSSKYHKFFVNHNRSGRYLNGCPIFTITLLLSDWSAGLEEWYSDSEWEAVNNGEEFTPPTISDFFEGTSCGEWSIDNPLVQYYSGIFADRLSAQKFLEFFNETIQSQKVKDCIMDIVRLVGSDSNYLERILNSHKNVRLHGLYDRIPMKLTSGSTTFHEHWFNKRID